MPIEQYTYWSITINNPDENDMLIVRNPNDKYIRSFVWTMEEGEEGTPHIQAWVRLQRNQSLSFVKKLYPRAHIKPCRKDEYNENTYQYAQKNDETTAGSHVISLNDPLPDASTVILRVLRQWDHPLTAKQLYNCLDVNGYEISRDKALEYLRKELVYVENDMVSEKPYLAKLFVSAIYERTLARFWRQFIYHVYILQQDAQEADVSEGSSIQEVVVPTTGEGDEDSASETTVGSDESGSVSGSSEDDQQESGEQSDWE